jgi:hypothetical protein
MRFIQDFKLKHIEAFISHELDKRVILRSIDIVSNYDEDEDEKYIRESDPVYQKISVLFSDALGNTEELDREDFIWYCESEELVKI